MYKLLFLILMALFVNTKLFSQIPSVDKPLTTSNDQALFFNQLIAKFTNAINAKNNVKALTYLTQAENLLVNFKDDDLTHAQIELAIAFAKIGNVEKAKFYQQQALALSRGKAIAASVVDLTKLAKSYAILNDTPGMEIMFEKAINTSPQQNKRPIKIAYVNSLFDVDENVKVSTLLTELYSDTPLSAAERAEILNLLLINSLKLNQLQHLDKYYQELEQLKPAQSATYFLAKGMYLEHKNQYTNALKNYHPLFLAFKAGKREIVYLDGVLQLAQLTSKQLKKDSANYFFNLVANVLHQPLKSTAIGVRYLKLYQAHQLRFNQPQSFNAAVDKALNTKDSLYQNELIALTKELAYKYKIEQDKQKAELLKKQRDVEALTYDKNRQRSLLIISCLCLLLIGGGAVIYILYQRRKQANLLHLAELARLKQLHKTDVMKTLSKSQEAERWRIADQLHDEVGSMISVVRLNLSEHPLKDEVISPEKLVTANRILANVADTVREMSHQLMPVAIRQYGLINSIEQLINDINTSGKIYIEHLIYGFDDLSKYPEDFQVSFYRIVQELFQNIVKHAKATNAIFQLVEHPDSINLYIEDNGKGIENDKNNHSGKGIGLLSNRIDYYEGKISIEGQPGKGTLIVIDIPTQHMVKES